MLTITAAALAFAATGAVAGSHMSDSRSEMHNNTATNAMSTDELAMSSGDLIRSRDITGGVVYTMNEANDEGWDSSATWDEVNPDWNQIGEIEDLVLTSDGMVTGIVAEVGGFLDVGDKHVVISVQDLSLVAVDDRTYAYVTKYNEEDLESMNGVDEGFWN
jgi:hypothetical protein